jgi:hypothetical protein
VEFFTSGSARTRLCATLYGAQKNARLQLRGALFVEMRGRCRDSPRLSDLLCGARRLALEEQRLADRRLDRVNLIGLATKKGCSGRSPVNGGRGPDDLTPKDPLFWKPLALLMLVFGGAHSTMLVVAPRHIGGVENDGHVLLSNAEESADRNNGCIDFTAAVEHESLHFADLFLLRIVNILLVDIGNEQSRFAEASP